MCAPAVAAGAVAAGAAQASAAAAATAATTAATTAAAAQVSSATIMMNMLSAAAAAMGQIQQSQAQAAISKQNAMASEQAALDAYRVGSETAYRSTVKGRSTMGSQVAALAASGVDPSSGTALSLQADTAGASTMDAQLARANAARQGLSLYTDARQSRALARNYSTSGMFGAANTLIGAAVKQYGNANRRPGDDWLDSLFS